ncbi:pilus assembly protein N-terminal domain-containing protein, partial [uncultured Phenylobacterium sp.]|uniref:pilus assembly protein N-terminal domain-containing protein n=1 Tax=uncultured Phenylobacterium sp. TaxID=349273 RepID=UPI0025FCB958
MLCWLVLAPLAQAQILPPERVPVATLQVAVAKAEALTVTGDIEQIVVSQPETAQVSIGGDDSIYVTGRQAGSTNLLVYGPGPQLLQVIDVNVGPDGRQLQDDLRLALPGETIKVVALSSSLILMGAVSTPLAAAVALDLAERAAPGEVISMLDVPPNQVLLEVSIFEASEENLRDVGVDLRGAGEHAEFRSGSGLVGPEAPQ